MDHSKFVRTNTIWTKKWIRLFSSKLQVIYRWAFSVAPALCLSAPPPLKKWPLLHIWLQRLWNLLLTFKIKNVRDKRLLRPRRQAQSVHISTHARLRSYFTASRRRRRRCHLHVGSSVTKHKNRATPERDAP